MNTHPTTSFSLYPFGVTGSPPHINGETEAEKVEVTGPSELKLGVKPFFHFPRRCLKMPHNIKFWWEIGRLVTCPAAHMTCSVKTFQHELRLQIIPQPRDRPRADIRENKI